MTKTVFTQEEWLEAIAHDLRGPVGLVRGCLDAIAAFGTLNEKQQATLERAFRGLGRMEHLISRLRDITWLDSDLPLGFETVNLKNLLDEVLDLLRDVADERSISIHTEYADQAVTVFGDRIRLSQVLDNLLNNAIKYNHEGGTVTISVETVGDNVLVKLKDTGIGIAPEELPLVFERFYRSPEGVKRRIDGSGLGLSITRGIVARHGGEIGVESIVGEGSTFWFSLPMAPLSEEGQEAVI